MDVLRTNSPSVFLVFEREGVAVLVQTANLVGMSNLFGSTRSYARGWVCYGFCPVTLSCIRTRPSEGTDSHSAHWHNPYATNHILLIINVLGVDALSVEYTNLVVQQVSAVGILEEITLQLQTDVTAIGSVFAGTVAETSQLAHVLRVSHEALVDRMHRILEGKWVLELTHLHLEIVVLLPFCKQIHHSWAGPQVGGVTVKLNLGLPVEVFCNATLQGDTAHSDVERVGFRILLSTILILGHTISRQFHIAQP